MDHDAISIPELNDDDLKQQVNDALIAHREWRETGNIDGLGHCKLAQNPLIQAFTFPNESDTWETRGEATSQLLYWLVDKLKPEGIKWAWEAIEWRSYNILYYNYLDKACLTFADLKNRLQGIDVYHYRNKAIEQIAVWLKDTLLQPQQYAGEQKRRLFNNRYEKLTENERYVLRLALIFRGLIPADTLVQLAEKAGIRQTIGIIHNLLESGLLMQKSQGGQLWVCVREEARSYLLSWSIVDSPEIRCKWHEIAAQWYLQNRDFLEAVYHLLEAGDYKAATLVLTQNKQDIEKIGESQALQELVNRIHPDDLLSETLWPELKIMEGDLALKAENVTAAIHAYEQALQTRDVYYRALAHHRLAKAYETFNLPETLEHYDRGIHLLKHYPNPDEKIQALQMYLYIDQAWVYMQGQSDFQKAEANLNEAETVLSALSAEDSALLAALVNAWARLAEHQKQQYVALMHRAWVVVKESGDLKLKMIIAHNIGMGYIWMDGEQDKGMDYLRKSLEIAKQLGDRQMEGSCYKTIGNGYFFKHDYDEAINYYEMAYAIFEEMGNRNWLGHVLHNMAEAYAWAGDEVQAYRYLAEAEAIAIEVKEQDLLKAVEELREWMRNKYRMLTREERVVQYLTKHERITNKVCQELLNVAASTVVLLFRKMVKDGILEKHGETKGVYYTLKSEP